MKKRTYKNGNTEEHRWCSRRWLRTRASMWMRTPIDDEHTMHWVLKFDWNKGDGTISDGEPEVEYLAPFKDPPDAIHPVAKFQNFPQHGWPLSQDVVMWETQGPVSDRTKEHLGASDKGVVMLRRMMFENIERVKRGEDPVGVIRDERIIDTKLEQSLHTVYPRGHVAEMVPV